MINLKIKSQNTTVIARSLRRSNPERTTKNPGLLRFARNDTVVKSAGFVLFFSLLVSSTILAAGLAVSRIVVRQILLASIQKDSQMALFAADAGIECAMYWKANYSTTPPSPTPTCNASNDLSTQMLSFVNKTFFPAASPAAFSTSKNNGFWFNLGENKDTSCVRIGFSEKTISGTTHSEINAYGYNVPCNTATGVPEGGRVVERGLRFTYQ